MVWCGSREKRQTETESGKGVGGRMADAVVWEDGWTMSRVVYEALLPHQRAGVMWMKAMHVSGASGGILGDAMGLGKTVQVAAWHHTWKRHQESNDENQHHHHHEEEEQEETKKRKKKKTWLVVCPPTLMHVWKRELQVWCGSDLHVQTLRDDADEEKDAFDEEEEEAGEAITQEGEADVVVATYEQVRRSWRGDVDGPNRGVSLHRRTWEYAVLDEGHRVRNPDAQITLACKSLHTRHRLVLTGSPIQNHLVELWSVMDFAFPGRLGTLPVFEAHFAVPIRLGAYANATSAAAATAFRCAVALKDAVAPYLLRRTKAEVDIQLPRRKETVLFCRLTPKQRAMYRAYLSSDQCNAILERKANALVGLDALRKICNHPELYECNVSQEPPSPPSEQASTSGRSYELRPGETDASTSQGYPPLPRAKMGSETDGGRHASGKMDVLMGLLRCWLRNGHRVLVFTQTQQMLDLVQREVRREGWKHLRMDGCTPIRDRPALVDAFQAQQGGDVFLLTTRVGGLGLSLVGANRVVLVDPDWNPATDAQAAERAWRIGQKRDVEIVRLITAGTVEEKIYHRQIHKQMLTERVLRDPAQKRVFANKDLHDLFVLEEEEEELHAPSATPIDQNQPHECDEGRVSDGHASKRARRETETERIFDLNGSLLALETEHEERAFPCAREESVAVEDENPGSRRTEATVVERLLEGDEAAAAKMLRAAVDHDDVTRAATMRAQSGADREARRVAQRAKEALLRSRKACYSQRVHVPTWTGRSGEAGGIDRFLPRVSSFHGSENRSRTRVDLMSDANADGQDTLGRNGISKGASTQANSKKSMSASNLLQHIRLREGDVPQEASQLQGIVEFLRKQPGTRATSHELIERFQEEGNKDVDPALFKHLLKEAATLERSYSPEGKDKAMWVLKPCFT